MVEQRPSKPHVWVRFLLSLYMLFKKPSIFVFKKKLNTLNSTQTNYVKNFKIKNFTNIHQINLILNKLDETSNSFDQTLKNKTLFFRKLLFQKWNLKRNFKMKFFSRSSLRTLISSTIKQLGKPSTNFTFAWNTQNTIKLSVNLIDNYTFVFSTNVNNFTPIKTITSSIHLYTNYFWTSLLSNYYRINILELSNTLLFKQLSKSTYLNQYSSQLTYLQFFQINRFDGQTWTTPLCSTQQPLIVNNKALVVLKKESSFQHLLIVLSKYLPHINLVRLFRRMKNKKTISYSIDKNLFFKSSLIRINLDYKFYTLNTLKTLWKKPAKPNVYSLFVRSLSRDNLLESKLDSILQNSQTFANFTPFPSPIATLKLSKQSSRQTSNNFLSQLSTINTMLFDSLNTSVVINQPLLYKYLFWLLIPNNNLINHLQHSLTSLNDHSFSTRINLFKTTNIWPSSFFHFTLKRKILKIFSFNKFLPNVTMWYYNILIRFMESCTGKKIFLKFNPFIENFLSFTDIARCNMWSIRINSFQKLLGPKIFLNESLRIMHIALRFKDPTFFANWIKGMLNRMSFWKYRLLFRYIKFAMRYLFWLYFSELQFKGLKIKLKGKISVAGNARTRTLVYRIGETGYSKIDNRVLCDSSTINTFTGVLGFKIWFFF